MRQRVPESGWRYMNRARAKPLYTSSIAFFSTEFILSLTKSCINVRNWLPSLSFSVSSLTLLVGRQEAHQTCKRSCSDNILQKVCTLLGPGTYPSRHQLSLPSLRGRLIEYLPVWLALRQGAFTCVGWQVTLWKVTSRSSEANCSGELYG